MFNWKKNLNFKNNYKFIDSAILNDATYNDYLLRFKRVALSVFEWVNLPSSMNAQFLEECLYYDGICALFKDEKFGFINTKCCSNGKLNIYELPTSLQCNSFQYKTKRKLYTGLLTANQNKDCILVQNNFDRLPTFTSMELFAYRLYESQRTADTNIIAQKTPVMIVVDEKQRLLMQNLYNQFNGNQPFIFGDQKQLDNDKLRAIKTDAPFVADKIMEYKKEIWNEALTFLGINNIIVDKKERLITDEANSNNELINLNLQSFLAPRQKACEQFNELFGLKGDKAISVRVRSDLHNIIKNEQSIIKDLIKEGEVEDGKIYDRTSQDL